MLNGLGAALYDREACMLSAISNEFELDIEDVRKIAMTAVADQKVGAIKPQRSQNKGEPKKPRKPSPYSYFYKANWAESKNLLKTDPKSRTFSNKNGDVEVIDPTEFGKDGEPVFAQVTKKVASMWNDLDDASRKQFVEQAEKFDPDAVVPEVAGAKKRKGKAKAEKVIPKKVLPKKKGKPEAEPEEADDDEPEADDEEEADAQIETAVDEDPEEEEPEEAKPLPKKKGGKKGGKKK